jgi:hypothetical protein
MRSFNWPLVAAMAAVCACVEPGGLDGSHPDSGGRTDAGQGGGAGGSGGMGGTGGMSAAGRPAKSGSIVWARSGSFSVAANPDLPSLFVAMNPTLNASAFRFDIFSPGDAPSSVALSPDTGTAWVVLRGAGAVAKVTSLPGNATVTARLSVCAEPAAVAVAPGGNPVVVACAGESAAVLIDTVTSIVTRIETAGAGRAIAITDDGDNDGWDEKVYVPAFFGEVVAEGNDRGRVGLVTVIELATPRVANIVRLMPISEAGAGAPLPDGGEGPEVTCSPNQLASIAILGNRAYVAHTCVSPAPPVHGPTSLFAGLSVIDLVDDDEVTGVGGSTTLAKLARNANLAGVSLMALPVDLATRATDRLYVLAQGAHRVAQLSVAPGQPITLVAQPTNGDLFICGGYFCDGGFTPFSDAGFGGTGGAGGFGGGAPELQGVATGLAVSPGGDLLQVNEWNAREVLTFDPASMLLRAAPLQLVRPPFPGSPEHRFLLGRKFFYTARDRWSAREVGSCASCHPDGLTDNVTWMFPAGPRQTPALDGTFARNDSTDHRAQNWTAVFDEIDDVEGVTRSLLGGKGAITQGPPGNDTRISLSAGVSLDGGSTVTRNDGLSGSSRAVVATLSTVKDWEEIELWIQAVRSNRAPTSLVAGDVTRGRQVFEAAGCHGCHGGAKWTLSRIPYQPSPEKNGSLPGDNGLPAAATGLRTEQLGSGAFKVAVESLPNPDGGSNLTVGPERITCVLREVGTFDAASELEKKADGSRSQGQLGFNPPSLLGLATSAPYLHDGSAKTLETLLQAPYLTHLRAGNAGFFPTVADKAALVAFLNSIDGTTPPFAIPSNGDICGAY